MCYWDCSTRQYETSSAGVLQEDPELKPMFEQIQTGGMAALQKAMSDPVSAASPLKSVGTLLHASAKAAMHTSVLSNS